MEILKYYEPDFWIHLRKSNIIPIIDGRLWVRFRLKKSNIHILIGI